jgi:hypothetical protein
MKEGTRKPVQETRPQPVRKHSNRAFSAFAFINPLIANTMPVITLCEGKENNFECPIRELCYRYKAKADPAFQSWFAYLPYNNESTRCESFIAAEKTKKNRNIEWSFFEPAKKQKSYS